MHWLGRRPERTLQPPCRMHESRAPPFLGSRACMAEVYTSAPRSSITLGAGVVGIRPSLPSPPPLSHHMCTCTCIHARGFKPGCTPQLACPVHGYVCTYAWMSARTLAHTGRYECSAVPPTPSCVERSAGRLFPLLLCFIEEPRRPRVGNHAGRSWTKERPDQAGK